MERHFIRIYCIKFAVLLYRMQLSAVQFYLIDIYSLSGYTNRQNKGATDRRLPLGLSYKK